MPAVLPYDPTFFNTLPHINDSGKLKLHDKATELGAIITKHGMGNLVGVARLHHHFKLNEAEMVAATVTDGRVELAATHADTVGAFPYMFAFDTEQNSLMSVQFCVNTNKHGGEMERRLAEVLEHSTFIKEFCAHVKKLDVCQHLGMHIVFHDLVKYDTDTHNLVECTDSRGRLQVMLPLSEDEQKQRDAPIITHWTWQPLSDKGPRTVPCQIACESWQHDMGPLHMNYCYDSDC